MGIATLHKDDRRLMERMLISGAKASERLTHICFGSSLVTGSPAEQFRMETLEVLGPEERPLLDYARSSLAKRNLAAFDFMRSFGVLISRGNLPGGGTAEWAPSVSLIGLTRSAIESFAKTNFVLKATDGADMLRRYVQLFALEVTRASKDSEFSDPKGELIDVEILVSTMSSSLEQAGIQLRAGKLGLMGMVHGLLAELHGSSARNDSTYGQWSQMSHSESESLSAFMDPTTGVVRLIQPSDLLRQAALTVFAADRLIDESLVRHFEPPTEEQARWAETRRGADSHWTQLVARQPYT